MKSPPFLPRLSSQLGASLLEFAILASLISIICIVVVRVTGDQISFKLYRTARHIQMAGESCIEGDPRCDLVSNTRPINNNNPF